MSKPKRSMKCAREGATAHELDRFGLLIHQLDQHEGYLVAKLLRHAKRRQSNHRDVGEARTSFELDHRAVLCNRGALLHGKSAQHRVLLENSLDSCRKISHNAFTLQILHSVV